jgi:hypothetical protein
MDSVFVLPFVLLFLVAIVKSIFFPGKKNASMSQNSEDVNQAMNQQNDLHQQMIHQQNFQDQIQNQVMLDNQIQMDNQMMDDQQSFQNSNSDSFTS